LFKCLDERLHVDRVCKEYWNWLLKGYFNDQVDDARREESFKIAMKSLDIEAYVDSGTVWLFHRSHMPYISPSANCLNRPATESEIDEILRKYDRVIVFFVDDITPHAKSPRNLKSSTTKPPSASDMKVQYLEWLEEIRSKTFSETPLFVHDSNMLYMFLPFQPVGMKRWDWTNLELTCELNDMPFGQFVFVNEVQERWNGVSNAQYFVVDEDLKSDKQMSVCARYIHWLAPRRLYQSQIRVWARKQEDVLYFFRSDLIFFQRMEFLAMEQPDEFFIDERQFEVDMCTIGANPITRLFELAFFYFKILPTQYMATTHISSSRIHLDKELRPQLQAFVAETPPGVKTSVIIAKTTGHALLFVYAVQDQRIEFYDSNNNPELVKKLHWLSTDPIPGVCSFWTPRFQYQQHETSCARWAAVFAMCRMVGVERSQLPTDEEVVADITRQVRMAIWHTCGLKSSPRNKFVDEILEDADRLLEECVVPSVVSASILRSIEQNKTNEPMIIPPDVQLCSGDAQFDSKFDCPTIALNFDEEDGKNLALVQHVINTCNRVERVIISGDISKGLTGFTSRFFSKLCCVTDKIILPPVVDMQKNIRLFGLISDFLSENENLHIYTQKTLIFSVDVLRIEDRWNRFHTDELIVGQDRFGDISPERSLIEGDNYISTGSVIIQNKTDDPTKSDCPAIALHFDEEDGGKTLAIMQHVLDTCNRVERITISGDISNGFLDFSNHSLLVNLCDITNKIIITPVVDLSKHYGFFDIRQTIAAFISANKNLHIYTQRALIRGRDAIKIDVRWNRFHTDELIVYHEDYDDTPAQYAADMRSLIIEGVNNVSAGSVVFEDEKNMNYA
jgi:hypothetical protein